MPRRRKNPPYDVDLEVAERLEEQVREALAASDPDIAKALKRHPEAVMSTLTSEADWLDPSPFTVYVFTEYGIGDPYDYELIEEFNAAADALRDDPWIEDAGWDSYNSAVQYFWIRPRMIA